jgi:hypothetical protein
MDKKQKHLWLICVLKSFFNVLNSNKLWIEEGVYALSVSGFFYDEHQIITDFYGAQITRSLYVCLRVS